MRRQLSKNETKELSLQLDKLYSQAIDKTSQAEIVDEKIVLINKKPSYFLHDGVPIPMLRLLLEKNFLKKVTVDMGAVKFVAKGADIMRPGIVGIEGGIRKDEAVSVIDQNNKKPLAVARSLYTTEEMLAMESGRVLESLHHVGDEMWNLQAGATK